MGAGGAPKPSRQQQMLNAQNTQAQTELSRAYKQNLEETQALQKQQRQRIAREEGTTAADEAELRSRGRRAGILSGDLVSAPGYGGFRRTVRGGRVIGRDDGSGVKRTYTPPAVAQKQVEAAGAEETQADRAQAAHRKMMREIQQRRSQPPLYDLGEGSFSTGSNSPVYRSKAREEQRRIKYQRAKAKGFNIPEYLLQ